MKRETALVRRWQGAAGDELQSQQRVYRDKLAPSYRLCSIFLGKSAARALSEILRFVSIDHHGDIDATHVAFGFNCGFFIGHHAA